MSSRPSENGVTIAEQTICRLFDDFDNIVAVKHATGSVEGAACLHAACEIDIISGDDPLTLPLLSVGAIGVISVVANLLPARVKSLTDAWLAGRHEQAQTIHDELFPLAKALLSLETNPIPIKTALALRGMIREEFRLPICEMAPANKDQLRQLLSRSGLLK